MFRLLSKIEPCLCHKCRFHFPFTKDITTIILRCKSHYTSLDLNSSASMNDIKSAYYKLSFKFHPDKNDGSLESTEKFREITEAYEILSNPEKKAKYDRELTSSRPGNNSYDFGKSGASYRRYEFHGRTSPRTGRTSFYNYDEHFKMHYEDYLKRKETDREFYARRWGMNPSPHGAYYRHRENLRSNRESSKQINKQFLFSFLFMWTLVVIFSIVSEFYIQGEPRLKGTVYYPKETKDSKVA